MMIAAAVARAGMMAAVARAEDGGRAGGASMDRDGSMVMGATGAIPPQAKIDEGSGLLFWAPAQDVSQPRRTGARRVLSLMCVDRCRMMTIQQV